MKKYEVVVKEGKVEKGLAPLHKLPFVRHVKETTYRTNPYSLASKQSLAEDWLPEDNDEVQKMDGK